MVKHVLKDGTVLDDISGHIVKMDDVGEFYTILKRVKNEGKCYESKFGKENTCNS